MRDKVRDGIPWVLVAVIALAVLGSRHGWFGLGTYGSPGPAPSSGPARSVALPGGGRSDGDKCGATGFHHFAVPTGSRSRGNNPTPPPGPQLTLGAFGFTGMSGQDPARIDVQLLFGAGGRQPLLLSPPLGPRGVAVEIEGPDGLVGGAYDLPVVLGPGTTDGSDGKIHIDPEVGGSATVILPLQALCPGYDGLAVVRKLDPPIDTHHTVTGPPPYTLTVSISDPAAGRIRSSIGSPVTGDVMSADNADVGDPPDA
ncbi:hypothetical protein SAMN05216223_111171 [Actinacidiphila yanglinensis]|uniref:Uncharacterized protein n=1 Tax=Actinacidiphila yanglinensis TaxID=310779 RepID=A0A1H6D2T8_9ACTN|nr:hypothetical protein [Actinacidiphila yanglinensis]SEG79600.1 hypothetical protein SAMN05216223_111171 [Actinacidiphila yanglinensis]